MHDYDPLRHPLELPVQTLTAHCLAERPFYLPPRPGATPGSTLGGAFGAALWSAACANRGRRFNPCLEHDDPRCRANAPCHVPWLYKPYSAVQQQAFTRPVLLRAEALEGEQPVEHFALAVVLWGRHAIAAREAVFDTLQRMGELGLTRDGERVRFRIEHVQAAPVHTLAQRVTALSYTRALLEFDTPFLHKVTAGDSKHFHTGPDLPLADMLGNTAFMLASWDMEDREADIAKAQRYDFARAARGHAKAAAQRVNIARARLLAVDIGERRSRGSGRYFPMQGFVGLAELHGELDPVMPWLLTLHLVGGGQKRALGFGAVKLWGEPATNDT